MTTRVGNINFQVQKREKKTKNPYSDTVSITSRLEKDYRK